jgi:GH18 family chitinase
MQKTFERIEQGDEGHLKGPETVMFGEDGTIYIMNDEEGFLVSITDFVDQKDGITITAKTNIVADLGMGGLLGGQFAEDNTLYIADAHLGLTLD